MRITGGEVRGRALHFPSRSNQRPTSDFLREALLNILGPLQDKIFLDLYTGSGSVGLEAASRGAKEIVLIEKNKSLITVIRKNIQLCGFEQECRLITADIKSGLRILYEKKYQFDIVFADPPYNKGFVSETLRFIKEYPVLKEEGILVLQHSIREKIDTEQVWQQKDQRKYGDNVITFLRMG